MGTWNELSNEISQSIQTVGKNIVTVQAGAGRPSSGIILDDQTILTAAHAISEREGIRVWISPAQPFTAALVGRDSGTDLAILKSDAKLGGGANFAESPQLAVGQFVVAIARTWRGNLVASAGILSGLMGEWHSHRGKKIDAFIRPDLNLYRGFSGGAMIGADQKIIGMTTSALRRGSPLVVPYATIQRVTSVLREKGHVPSPYLGLGLQPVRVPESLQRKLNLTQRTAVLVVHVESAGPADKAGVLLGDVLLTIADRNLGDEGTTAILSALTPGQTAKIGGVRGGGEFTSSIQVGERPHR
jgi:S1-C subfamily serine protease